MKKYIIWIIYIIITFFAVIYFWKISPRYSKEDINAEAPFGLYKDMITMIKRDNYIFDYDITTDIKIKYYGKKDGNKEQSVVYYNDEIGDIISLKEFIDLDLINPNYIFDILEDNNEYILNKENDKRTFTYNIDLKERKMRVIVETDLASITNISICFDEITYHLKYENIGFTTIN